MTQATLPEYQKPVKNMSDEELNNLVAMLRKIREDAVLGAQKSTKARSEKKAASRTTKTKPAEKPGMISRADLTRIAMTLPEDKRAAFLASFQ
jgi:hypothetical protein